MKRILLAVFFISNILYSQEKIIDTVQGTKQNLDEVIVKGIRAKFSSPISYSNIYKEKLKNKKPTQKQGFLRAWTTQNSLVYQMR